MNISAHRFTTKTRTWLFIAALETLERRAQTVPLDVNPAFALHRDPLRRQGVAKLFSTHPPVAERVRRLRALDGDQPFRVVAERVAGTWEPTEGG